MTFGDRFELQLAGYISDQPYKNG